MSPSPAPLAPGLLLVFFFGEKIQVLFSQQTSVCITEQSPSAHEAPRPRPSCGWTPAPWSAPAAPLPTSVNTCFACLGVPCCVHKPLRHHGLLRDRPLVTQERCCLCSPCWLEVLGTCSFTVPVAADAFTLLTGFVVRVPCWSVSPAPAGSSVLFLLRLQHRKRAQNSADSRECSQVSGSKGAAQARCFR